MDTTRKNLRTFYAIVATQTLSILGSRLSGLAVGFEVYRDTGEATPLLLVMGANASGLAWPDELVRQLATSTIGAARMVTIPGMGHALNPVVIDDLAGAILTHTASVDGRHA